MGRSDTWLTPPEIIAALGPFDLDPCAAVGQPWPTAAHHYTITDNGLLRRWWGRVWLNPPYSNVRPWLGRMADHGMGTAFLFSRTETKAFFDFVWGVARLALFMRGRVHFYSLERKPQHHAPEASILLAYGEQDADRLAESGLDGQLVMLSTPSQVVVALPATSWREVVAGIFQRHGGELALSRIYALLADHPKAEANQHWQAKIRQQVQTDDFERVGRGVYRYRRAA